MVGRTYTPCRSVVVVNGSTFYSCVVGADNMVAIFETKTKLANHVTG